MDRSGTTTALLATGLLGVLTISVGFAEDAPKEDAPKVQPAPLIILDSAGKEQKLKSWKFVQGTRRLAWLAGPAEGPDPKPKEPEQPTKVGRPKAPLARATTGPEALELREENSTTFANGILTLIPLERLRSLDYDSEKELVTAKVAAGDKPDADVALTGLTKYRNINKIAIEAEVDKGELGVAELRYLGGIPKGIRGLRFAEVKATPPPMGRPASVSVADKGDKTAMPVTELQALYRLGDGEEKLSMLLFFKKTLKVDVSKIKKITTTDGDGQEPVWQVTLKDGNEETLTLLRSVMLDGKPAVLEGLLGRVPAGYKLFPIHTVGEVEFESAKEVEK